MYVYHFTLAIINIIVDFSLTQWLQDGGIPSTTTLPSYIAVQLENDLGLSPFLMVESCELDSTQQQSSSCASGIFHTI